MSMSSVVFLLVLGLFIEIGACLECKNDPNKNLLLEETYDDDKIYKILDLIKCGNEHLEMDEDLKDRDYLNATYNSISELEANISNLLKIDLHDNQIKEISREAFKGLSKLTHLYLDNNLIEELKVGTFDPLVGLKVLALQENKIKILMEGIFDKNLNLEQSYLSKNVIIAVAPTVLKPGKNWYLGGNTCVKSVFKNNTILQQNINKCVENYELLRGMCIFFDFFSNSKEENNVQDRIQINDLATTENFKLNFLSIIFAGLFTISLLLNVIQFVRTKRVTQTQATIPSPANEPVTYYLTMNAETVGARSLSLRPNNDRVEAAAYDDGEEHIYDVLKEGNKSCFSINEQ